MGIRHLKIGAKLGLVLVIGATAYAGLLSYLLATYHTRLQSSSEENRRLLEAVDLGRQAQVRFKIQVQEWKNVLLRGSDPELLAKYRKAFDTEEASVQRDLGILHQRFKDSGTDVARLERLRASHAKLGEKYRAALADFDGSLAAATRVDKAVRGIDRAPTDEMDALVADVKALAERSQTQAASDNAALWRLALGLSIVILGALGVFSVWFCRDLSRRLRQLVEAARDIGDGEADLTRRVDIGGQDELGMAAASINRFIGTVHDIVAQARGVAAHSSDAAQQVSGAAAQLSNGGQAQASSLEETAASMEQVAGTVRQTSDNARQASRLATESRATAETGRSVIEASVTAMDGITRASKRIAEITGVIDEIAFQTNLLALNAAVEAARAGEQGRGFAVVAAEVRNLAQRSATAAREIKALIHESVQQVEQGSTLVGRSGQTLDDIVAGVRRVSDIVAEIAAASEEQTRGIDQVNRVVSEMDRVVQSNASHGEELATTAQTLANQSRELERLVGRFRVGETEGTEASAPAPVRPSARVTVTPPPAPRRRRREPSLAMAGVSAGAEEF